jgi:Transposase
VAGWLSARPGDWPARIATVALDPWHGYASALVTPLGHATVVVDHFHAVRLAKVVVDQVRRRIEQATWAIGAASPIRCTASASCCRPRPSSSPAGVGAATGWAAAGDPTGEVTAAGQGTAARSMPRSA